MKLYYSPGACSLASHILLKEVAADHAIEKVDLRAKTTETGADFTSVNPKGSVPALALDSGEVLTEGVAIMQFVADTGGVAELSPPVGSLARARLQEALNFISSEVHKAYSPLFRGPSEEAKPAILENLTRRLGQVEAILADGRAYLTGPEFSAADAYLFTVTNWSGMLNVDMSAYPALAALRDRVAARPSVQAAMKAESLI